MNIRDLKYLAALSEHCHFGKAAEACFVSQPALSMQIKKLEDELGVQLLERTNKSVMITKIGKEIAEHARLVLQNVDALHTTAKLAKDSYSCELKIGIIPTLAPYLLPYIISLLTKKFPKISFYLIEEKTEILEQYIKDGKCDVVILATSMSERDYAKEFIFDEEFLLAVPNSHALAKRKKISYENLTRQNILLLADGHCLRDQALTFCHKNNKAEIHPFQATSLETLRHMVIANIGITLIPKLACENFAGISYLEFSSPKPKRIIECYWRKTNAKVKVISEVTKEIKKKMKDV